MSSGQRLPGDGALILWWVLMALSFLIAALLWPRAQGYSGIFVLVPTVLLWLVAAIVGLIMTITGTAAKDFRLRTYLPLAVTVLLCLFLAFGRELSWPSTA